MSMKKEQLEALSAFIQMASYTNFHNIFSGMPLDRPKSPYEQLGDGYDLRPIEILEEGGQIVVENRLGFSHLYHNDLKVTDIVFRKGGLSNGFKDGYCQLIMYEKQPGTMAEHGFDFGTHVIINNLGEIVLRQDKKFGSTPSHEGGNIGKLKDTYFNLLTGEEIMKVGSRNSINSANYIFVEHSYDWYNKELPLGVYQICKKTGEYQFIDHVK